MVELKFNISDVDYESIIQAMAGYLAPPVVMAVRAMPDSAREDMAVKYLNANSAQMERWLESALAANGVHMKISQACATKLP